MQERIDKHEELITGAKIGLAFASAMVGELEQLVTGTLDPEVKDSLVTTFAYMLNMYPEFKEFEELEKPRCGDE